MRAEQSAVESSTGLGSISRLSVPLPPSADILLAAGAHEEHLGGCIGGIEIEIDLVKV